MPVKIEKKKENRYLHEIEKKKKKNPYKFLFLLLEDKVKLCYLRHIGGIRKFCLRGHD